MPVEPRARRPRRGAPVRRDEEDAHVVRRRQDRLPHAAHALPDLAAVHLDHALRRDLRRPSCSSRTARMRRRRDRAAAPARSARFTAKAVIICTGGCGRVFPFTTNANICTGDGMALAYRGGRAAQRHGDGPVPSDRPALHRHPDYRGRARRGRLAAQQGRLPLSAGLRPGQAARRRRSCAAWSSARATASRRRSSASWRRGARIKGPYGDYVHLDLRHLGEAQDRIARSRWCASYASSTRISIRCTNRFRVRPVQHYMMGGVHTDINGRDPAQGTLCGGRGGLRQHQRRQSAGLQFARRVAGVRRARRRGRRPSTSSHAAPASVNAGAGARRRRGAPNRTRVPAQNRRHRDESR